jgi:hypothetical protein
MNLDEIEAIAKAATPGPYFIGDDTATDAKPHANSGLALVDTGRDSDWPIARLCEWNSANHIAACSPERIINLVRVARAADRVVQQTTAAGAYALHDALIDALRALEETP